MVKALATPSDTWMQWNNKAVNSAYDLNMLIDDRGVTAAVVVVLEVQCRWNETDPTVAR